MRNILRKAWIFLTMPSYSRNGQPITIASKDPIDFKNTCYICNYANKELVNYDVEYKDIPGLALLISHLAHALTILLKPKPIQIPICKQCYRHIYVYRAAAFISLVISGCVFSTAFSCQINDSLKFCAGLIGFICIILSLAMYVFLRDRYLGIAIQYNGGIYKYQINRRYSNLLRKSGIIR